MYDLDLQTWDWDIRAAACEVWDRLPIDAKAVLDGTKVYSREGLTLDGLRVFGYARQSTKAIHLREDGVQAAIVMAETICHELAHLYLGRTGADFTDENAVKALMVRWGFERERRLGRLLIGD